MGYRKVLLSFICLSFAEDDKFKFSDRIKDGCAMGLFLRNL